MNYLPDTVTRVIRCRKGGMFIFAGELVKEALPAVQIFVCPTHGDKITVHTGMPRRRWSYVDTLSEGAKALPYSSQYLRFYREEKGAEATKAREYRRKHKIR